MKKLTVGLVLAAFAMVTSLQAGEKSEKGNASCGDKDATACSASAKACCGDKAASSAKNLKLRHTLKGATLLARM